MTRRTTGLDPAEVYVYVPPEVCDHEHTEDVFMILDRTTDHPSYGNGGRPVALMCTHCLAVLPTWHGCGDCEFVEVRRALCEVTPRLVLGQPCKEHSR